jgi:antitoxin (DNA-binding transcriptional repressor) of toxin-antitoxin stability system
MSQTVSIEQASSHLGELVRGLRPNEEIVLTDGEKPVARIVANSAVKNRDGGAWKGKLEIIDDDLGRL